MNATVYIPAYNASGTLATVIDAILAQTRGPDQVLVVDDGSTDATASIAGGYARLGVELLRQDRNRGLGAARNRALAAAAGDVLVGIDADVRPEPDYLENTLTCFARFPRLGAMCGRLVEQHTATVADRWRSVHMSQDSGTEASDEPRFLYGCTTSIQADVARRVGGWNERFTHSYEDVDLTNRLREQGIALRYEPRSVARHLKRDTIASVLTAFWRWFYPTGDLAGHFDSLETWVDARLEAVHWSLFRHRFAAELENGRDTLLPVTLLMPWWMNSLDLEELGKRHRRRATEIASVRGLLPEIAGEVLRVCQAPDEFVRWVESMLAAAQADEPPVFDGESHAVGATAAKIRESALASVRPGVEIRSLCQRLVDSIAL